jgi:hypothetical protein
MHTQMAIVAEQWWARVATQALQVQNQIRSNREIFMASTAPPATGANATAVNALVYQHDLCCVVRQGSAQLSAVLCGLACARVGLAEALLDG